MLILKIIYGLIGIGVVVFVHELGHFLAARFVGIEVEAFSIGWGNPLLKKKIGKVEYRLGIFPMGGYCKLKGETDFQEALSQNRWEHQAKGSYFAASPWRRIVVAMAGPLANVLFAAVAFIFIWGAGFDTATLDNRIVLVSDIDAEQRHPADEAGLKSGDRIIAIDGKPVGNSHDIQELIAPNAGKALALKVDRDGGLMDLSVTPVMDKASGAGKIGIYFWTDPVIAGVKEGSPASLAGLREDDRINRVNGQDFPYTLALSAILRDTPPVLNIEFDRAGQTMNTDMVMPYTETGGVELGIEFKIMRLTSPPLSPLAAVIQGSKKTLEIFTVSVKSLALLFQGVDLTKAVSGPVRITYMLGDVAAEGFGEGFGAGLSSMANFLALISVALCIMNLLPIPMLDGGMIVLFILEGLRGKPFNPRLVSIFHTIGAVFIFGLTIFALFGDILFFVSR